MSARLLLQKARTGRNVAGWGERSNDTCAAGPTGSGHLKNARTGRQEPPRTRGTMYPAVVQQPDVPMKIGRSENLMPETLSGILVQDCWEESLVQ